MKITRPTLLIDKRRALVNIHQMSHKANQNEISFRPHFKTHQSARIGKWFRKEGISKITVSSVEMAAYFANYGWDDITIAFPVNILEISEINQLAKKIKLGLLVESNETIRFLGENLRAPVRIWIKVDIGYHRTGIPWNQEQEIFALIRETEKKDILKFQGLLTHAGHAYHVRGIPELNAVYEDSVHKLLRIKRFLLREGVQQIQLSYGDTPTCSIINNFAGLDEIRPGNFIFYDVMQLMIGSCMENQIAAAVACPVVAKHTARRELVIYGGAVHLSKEYLTDTTGQVIFGYATSWDGAHWGPIFSDGYVTSLTQEHGIIRCGNTFFNRVNIGNVIVIIPVHSCLTMNLMRHFRVI
jgi:D-serine deaminase-like pyridoxal phosphate-dependent protein